MKAVLTLLEEREHLRLAKRLHAEVCAPDPLLSVAGMTAMHAALQPRIDRSERLVRAAYEVAHEALKRDLASFAQRKLGLDRKTVARLMAAFGHHDMSRRSVVKSLQVIRALEARPDYSRISNVISRRAVALSHMQFRFQERLDLQHRLYGRQNGVKDVRDRGDLFGNPLTILFNPLSAIARIREVHLRGDSQ